MPPRRSKRVLTLTRPQSFSQAAGRKRQRTTSPSDSQQNNGSIPTGETPLAATEGPNQPSTSMAFLTQEDIQGIVRQAVDQMNSLRQAPPPNTSAISTRPTDSSESTLATMSGSSGVLSTCSEQITNVGVPAKSPAPHRY